jgi:hypothetical protein
MTELEIEKRSIVTSYIAVSFLGFAALAAVIGVLVVALHDSTQSSTTTTTPLAVQTQTSTTPRARTQSAVARTSGQSSKGNTGSPAASARPQAVSTTTDQDPTALSVLATIASAAIGGLAGMLTLRRST